MTATTPEGQSSPGARNPTEPAASTGAATSTGDAMSGGGAMSTGDAMSGGGAMSTGDAASTEDAISSGMASGDNEAVMRALAVSIALLPQSPPEEGEDRPEGAVALPVIEQDGTQYIPVFTSEAALVAAGADAGTAVRLPMAQLAANWPSDDLWLAVNPAAEGGLTLPAEVVRALPIFASLPDGTVVVDVPVDDDTEVIVDITDDAGATAADRTSGAEAGR